MTRVAAIDCGTNSTRLLIADHTGATLVREMRITRLGQGVDATGALAPEALARNYECLEHYGALLHEHGVDQSRLVATSAARDASNGPEFLAHAARITGAEVVILSGDEEAQLSYRGATADLPPSDRATMIVDIGGGSTELAALVDGVLRSYSMQLGCVRLAERAIGPGVVSAQGADLARRMVEEGLDEALSEEPALATLVGRIRLVGLAGSVSTLAQIDAGLEHYSRAAVHHRTLSRDDVGRWRERLGAESAESRLRRPGMVPGREDVLVGGLFVLEGVMDRFGVDSLLTSESDILDGIVSVMLSGQ